MRNKYNNTGEKTVADVEIIYLKRELNKDYLKPDISIHSSQGYKIKKNPENNRVKNEINPKKPFFSPKKTAYLIICFVIIGVVLSSSFNAGYIPVKNLLEIKEPIGMTEEIDIEKTIEEYSLPVEEIPSFENVKYKIYGSDKSKGVIEADYIDELTDEGYTLKYRGTKNVKGFDLKYYGFIKGITAVVIVTTSDDNYIKDHETLVLYSIGSVFDYAKILRDNTDLLKL